MDRLYTRFRWITFQISVDNVHKSVDYFLSANQPVDNSVDGCVYSCWKTLSGILSEKMRQIPVFYGFKQNLFVVYSV